jgi:adenylate cyclase class 2
MREVEIKAKIDSVLRLKELLESQGCTFSEPVTHTDTVYVEKIGTFEDFMSNSYFPRIRETSTGKIIFTFKKDRDPAKTDRLDKIEYEVEVSSKEMFEKILAEFGLHPAVTTTKTRVKAKFDEYEICLDEVVGLGSFIEIEKDAGDDLGYDEIHEELATILEKWGIDRSRFVNQGYDILTLLAQ